MTPTTTQTDKLEFIKGKNFYASEVIIKTGVLGHDVWTVKRYSCFWKADGEFLAV